ncbi:MAG: VTT domain-containing protein [Candidatus Aenigmarchaeota archaeon]|nr:VTT domain-containing protein [Candidatus Aenigmarchaeota archaeon]
MNLDFFLMLLEAYGYLGVLLVSMIGSSTIFLPLPSIAVIFAASSLLNPVLVGIFSGLGSTIGEGTAYALGFGGEKIIEKRWKKDIAKLEQLFARHGGFFMIMFLAMTPLPFDIIGIFSGTVKYPFKKFFLATLIGKIVLHTVVALAGFYSIGWVLETFASFS